MNIEEWLNGNQLSIDIWNNKYRYEDETFEEWLDRISSGNTLIRQCIEKKKFLFGGRILANRGIIKKDLSSNNCSGLTLSNCYVLPPVEDSIEGIYDTCRQLARTFSYGGGCGIDISKLRPAGAKVNNAAKTTSGAVSFMQTFSQVAETIGQKGRRGATMISIDVNHPDIEQFIDVKTDLTKVTGANISVRVNDDFMKAVRDDKDYILHYPCDIPFSQEHTEPFDIYDHPYGELINGIFVPKGSDENIHVYYKKVKAKELFNKLAKNNWGYAEPGILYWDTINNYNMLDTDPNFKYHGVNPCAEEPLPAGGSCLLGSINLAEFVHDAFTDKARVNFQDLEWVTRDAVNALNEVLIEGLPLHPLEMQRQSVNDWRQIGLGTFGLADMLIKLGVTYGSSQSIDIIKQVYKTIATTAVITSLDLAKEHGCYPMCNKEALANSSFIKYLELSPDLIEEIEQYGLYNSQLLTCAPTGSTATMLQVSTGVEPNFAFEFNRRTISLNKEETTYKVYADIVNKYRLISHKEELPEYFISSQQISPIDRIDVQAALQLYIDASISSTINLPEETTVEEIAEIYYRAWESGLKGVTIWRDNCLRQGILTTSSTPKEEVKELQRGYVKKAGDNCIGLKRTLTTGCGTLHCEAFFDPITGDLLETYLSKGSTGGCNNFMIGLSRMISLAARGGLSIEDILDQLKSCGTCPSYAVRRATKGDTSVGSCCPVAVGNALRSMHKEVLERIKSCSGILLEAEHIEEFKGENCPQCGDKTLIHTDGCIQCTNCGYSKCG